MTTDDTAEVYFGLRLHDGAADHAYCDHYFHKPRELRHLLCCSLDKSHSVYAVGENETE